MHDRSLAAFRPYGPDHLAVLALLLAGALLLIRNTTWIRRINDDCPVRYALAAALLINGAASWICALHQGFVLVPLHFCDFALLFVVWALLFGGPRYVKELAFFWGLAGSSQAVFTPDLYQRFPDCSWIVFFFGHGGVILSAIYLAARGSLELSGASVWRAWLGLSPYAAFAGLVNWGFGTNFGYLARKPGHPSVLDYLGPWPFYILGCGVIAAGLFSLCYVFWLLTEQMADNDVVRGSRASKKDRPI
ncbi:MAG: TIGR02206 family membrane protein [Candidatus Omnitrophota bacterium]